MALDKQGKEKLALMTGFLLILAVAILTFQRAQDNEAPQGEKIEDISEAAIDYPVISASELQNKLLAQETVRILDMRSPNEFVGEHIAHSFNIPIENLAGTKIGDNKDELLVLVGGGNMNYSTAVKTLRDGGYTKAVVMSGGFAAWKDSKSPTISSGDPSSFTDQAKITFTTPEKLKELIDTGESIYILDVRSPSAYVSGHLPGAKNIPLQELENREKELPVSLEIVIYGDTELQGFQAGVIAYDLNYFTAYVLQGNIAAWKEKGFGIVK